MSDIDKRPSIEERIPPEKRRECQTAQSAEQEVIETPAEAHAEGYVEAAKERAYEAYEGTKEAVSGAAHAVVDKASELADAVVEKVYEVKDAAAEKAIHLKESVLGTVEDTKAPAEGLREDTSSKVSEMRDIAAQKAAEYRDYAAEKLEQIKENTGQAASQSKGWVAEKAEQVKHLAEEYADSLVQKSGEVQAALSPQNIEQQQGKPRKGRRHTNPEKEYKEHLSEYRVGEIDDEAAEEAGEFLHMAEESAEEHDAGDWGPAKGKRVRRRNRRNSLTDPEKLRKERLSETLTGNISDEAAEEAGEFLHMAEESVSDEERQQKGKSGKRVQRGEVGVALKDRNIPVNMMDALERKQRLSETRHIGEIDDDTAQEAGEFLHMTEESAGEEEHFKGGKSKAAKKHKKKADKSQEFRHEVEKIEEQMPKLDNAKGWTRRR